MSELVTTELRKLVEMLPAEYLKSALLLELDAVQDYEADVLLRNIAHRAAGMTLADMKPEEEGI